MDVLMVFQAIIARARDPRGGQAIAQDIPEVQVPRRVPRRVQQQRTVRFEDVPLPQVSQGRISERIQEQIVDALESQGIPQKRISERIVEQIVPVPQVLPQELISERIHTQTVDVPLPQVIHQERILERIVEQIVDAEMGTPRAAAAASAVAACPGDGVFRTFPRKKKSATSRPESTANLQSHSSSWTPAAYEVEEYKYFDCMLGMAWRRRWSGSGYWFLEEGRWRGPLSKAPWEP